MEKIKIRFKNGLVGYFKLINENESIKDVYNVMRDKILKGYEEAVQFIDIEDNKRTLVRLSDVSTFGYSE